MASAEFSKFAGILSIALSQHHLLGFEIAQLEFLVASLTENLPNYKKQWTLESKLLPTKLVEVMEFQLSYLKS